MNNRNRLRYSECIGRPGEGGLVVDETMMDNQLSLAERHPALQDRTPFLDTLAERLCTAYVLSHTSCNGLSRLMWAISDFNRFRSHPHETDRLAPLR